MHNTTKKHVLSWCHKATSSWGLGIVYAIATLLSFGLVVNVISTYDGTKGPAMTTQTWPAGTFLSNFPEGDRINTYHRNFLMLNGQAGTGIWDISNPTAPKRVQFSDAANNGHRWWKLGGDLFYREYSVPEVQGTGYKYLDLSNMLDRKPITSSDVLYTVKDGQTNYDNLETFPHTIDGSRVFDMRTGEQVDDIPASVALPDVVVRVGNYVFYAPQTGAISVFDFGNPKDIQFLGSFAGDIPHEQYSTGIQLWRNYLVFMSGNQGPDALVGFDISDPTEVKRGFSLHSDEITLGRYMIFQDQYGFTGRFDRGVKYNFETMRLEQEFIPPSSDEMLQFIDNQWMPIGHILVASGDDKTSIFAHQDGLDTNPPQVGHHFPVAGAINQAVTTTIGFVINETLNDLTLNDQTIQVRPLGGTPIPADVTTSSYQVINFVPKSELLPNTTYEVKLIKGGIQDAVGNGIDEYIFYFTTGGDLSNAAPKVSEITLSKPSPVQIDTAIDFTANATDADGNALQYRWNFGDETPQTDWTINKVTHSYKKAGNYNVQVQVSDGNGGFVVASQSIVVTDVLPNLGPVQSAPMALDTTNRWLWVANPDNNSVTKIDADTYAVLDEIPVGKDPVSLALDGSNQLWVSCRDSDALYILNANGILVKKIDLPRGTRPYAILFSNAGDVGFVSGFGSGTLLQINPISKTISKTIEIGQRPRALAMTADNQSVLVSRFISPDTEGQLWEVDPSSLVIKNTIALPIDKTTVDNGNEARGLPNYISGITVHPNGKSAWAVAKKDNILQGLARDGQPPTFDNVVRTSISSIDLEKHQERIGKRLDIDNHGQPSSALYTPTGNYLIVSMQGNNKIIFLDPQTGAELLKKSVGKAPQGMLIDPKNGTLFVKNFMDRSVTVLDAKDLIYEGTPLVEEIATITTVSKETLPPDVFNGKQIFYNAEDLRMGTDGYVSCASCHIDGTEDGRVWDFTDRGQGLRNTISLIGRAGTAHGKLHWSANFDEIQDFENDIRFHFKGKGFLSTSDFNTETISLPLGAKKAGKSADLDALAAYVESLNSFDPSPYRKKDGSLTADGIAGKSIFENLQCASCHSGNAFTDSPLDRLHDVGTLEASTSTSTDSKNKLLGLDVPTLKGIWRTAPYLHNGSAKTLQSVFTDFNPTGAHGNTAGLTAKELNQLESYLKQIDDSENIDHSALELKMTSPKDGSAILTAESVPLSIATTITGITKVSYYVDNKLVAEVKSPPFESKWKPLLWKKYKLRAKIFYNQGKTASVTPEVQVQFKKSVAVLLVVGDKENLSSEEQRIKSRLTQQFGFLITVFSDEEADSPQSVNPFDLVLVSSSVDPRVLGNDLESARVPLLTWNPFMYNRLKLTSGALQTGYGITATSFSEITITNPTHPMAAGGTMQTALYTIDQSLPYGKPSEVAIVIAKAGTQPILFGYEPSKLIPSRRTAFPLRDQFMHLLTDQGLKMFDAAVLWTLYGGNAKQPIGSLPDVYFTSPQAGQFINAPIQIKFETEGWDLPSQQYKLRFKIDGQDRGLIQSEGVHIDNTNLSEGPHLLSLQMERSDNSVTELGETIQVIVTKDVLPQSPTVVIQSPSDGGLVGPNFSIAFKTFLWDIESNGPHVRYYIDEEFQGSAFTVDPISVSNLAEGPHSIRLALADATGELVGEEAKIDIRVDNRFSNLIDTDFSVEYRDNSSGINTAELKPIFQIVNASDQDLDLKNFDIKYWFTSDQDIPMAFHIDYAQPKGVIGNFGKQAEDQYLQLGFSNQSGMIAAKSKSGQIQTRLHYSGYQSHEQSDDFSYDASKRSLQAHPLVTLYYRGELVWGLEPNGQDPDTNTRPEAAFVTDILSGTAPLLVHFDASTSSDADGDTLTYAWEFGNGKTASGVQTKTLFDLAGDYEVQLKVSDSRGKSDTQTVKISVQPTPNTVVASFVASTAAGIAPLSVRFDSSSSVLTNPETAAYLWDFADGSNSTAANPTHVYTQSGTYAVSLRISNQGVSDTSELFLITVTEESIPVRPVADFVTDVVSGFAPLTVSFDASNSIDHNEDTLRHTWFFEENQSATGVKQTHTFLNPGTYPVSLTVYDGEFMDTKTKTITVTESQQQPPSTPINQKLSLLYRDAGRGNATDNMINPHFVIKNEGKSEVEYKDLKIRYWFTSEGSPNLNFWCDWAQLGAASVKGNFGLENKYNFLEIQFDPIAGSLKTGTASGDIQARIAKTNWTPFDETDDYSYNPAALSYLPNLRIGLYYKEILVWGKEPPTTKIALGQRKLAIQMYPNPIQDKLEVQSLQVSENATIQVIDAFGKIVKQVDTAVGSEAIQIDLSNLPSGIYFAKVKQQKQSVIQQIIKK